MYRDFILSSFIIATASIVILFCAFLFDFCATIYNALLLSPCCLASPTHIARDTDQLIYLDDLHLPDIYTYSNAIVLKTINVSTAQGEYCAALSAEGDFFMRDVTISIFCQNALLYSISVPDGYSPVIESYNFNSSEQFLFYSASTGGSGGYGHYMLFRLTPSFAETVYDSSLDSDASSYSASFRDGGQLIINGLVVNAKFMDTYYYDMIFDDAGNVRPMMSEVSVNDISTVFVCFNASIGLYQLSTFRSVIAVAEVNRLGYILDMLVWNGRSFTSYMTSFDISLSQHSFS